MRVMQQRLEMLQDMSLEHKDTIQQPSTCLKSMDESMASM